MENDGSINAFAISRLRTAVSKMVVRLRLHGYSRRRGISCAPCGRSMSRSSLTK